MSVEQEQGSPEIPDVVNAENASQCVRKCKSFIESPDWASFDVLYPRLQSYASTVLVGAGNNKFIDSMASLRQQATDAIVENLKAQETFEEFCPVLRRLRMVVVEPKTLWDLMETHLGARQEAQHLRVTLHQTQLLAAEFFTPSQLFEFGFEAFSKSLDMAHVNEEALIDIFYAVAGFVLGCNLPQTFVTSLEVYCEFIQTILGNFMSLPDFDARRFVWLVEVIRTHLHIHEGTLRQICISVITEYLNSTSEKSASNKLYKLCVISTSPFMKKLDLLKTAITDMTTAVLADQQLFLRKYVFSNFAMCDWTSVGDKRNSDAFKCWKLYIVNVAAKLQERPEYPMEIMSELIDESLALFEGYFAEVQPTWRKSANMRMDIFGIVETCAQYYPSEIPDDSLKRMWYLLYIAAMSGAGESEIGACKPAEEDDSDAPFLGLDRTDCEFIDYKLALAKLSKKFESEFETFETMAKFVRLNYKRQ